jgi:hypothetical protein
MDAQDLTAASDDSTIATGTLGSIILQSELPKTEFMK